MRRTDSVRYSVPGFLLQNESFVLIRVLYWWLADLVNLEDLMLLFVQYISCVLGNKRYFCSQHYM